MSPGASKGVSLAGPQRKTKIGNQRKLLHLESKAYCGTELGNSGTTMFDVLRAYWLPISQNSLPHQCATPLRSTSDSGIDTEIFNDFPLQTGFLMCSVPEKRERFEQKENETSFLAKDLPVDKLRRDIKKSWKDKSRTYTLQSRGLGGQIPKSRNSWCAPHFCQEYPKALKQNVQDCLLCRCGVVLPIFFWPNLLLESEGFLADTGESNTCMLVHRLPVCTPMGQPIFFLQAYAHDTF